MVTHNPNSRPYDVPWVVLDHESVSRGWSWTPLHEVDTILDEIGDFADGVNDWIDFFS